MILSLISSLIPGIGGGLKEAAVEVTERAANGARDAAKEAANGADRAAENLASGVRDAAREARRGVQKLGSHVEGGMIGAAKEGRKGLEQFGSHIEYGMHEVAVGAVGAATAFADGGRDMSDTIGTKGVEAAAKIANAIEHSANQVTVSSYMMAVAMTLSALFLAGGLSETFYNRLVMFATNVILPFQFASCSSIATLLRQSYKKKAQIMSGRLIMTADVFLQTALPALTLYSCQPVTSPPVSSVVAWTTLNTFVMAGTDMFLEPSKREKTHFVVSCVLGVYAFIQIALLNQFSITRLEGNLSSSLMLVGAFIMMMTSPSLLAYCRNSEEEASQFLKDQGLEYAVEPTYRPDEYQHYQMPFHPVASQVPHLCS